MLLYSSNSLVRFLSTPSARRATLLRLSFADCGTDFYPRPPRGGRPRSRSSKTTEHYFYPRPPRGGRRPTWEDITQKVNFYPRPPRGGRPRLDVVVPDPADISIHALREEGDARSRSSTGRPTNFYPRPPRGGRRAGVSVFLIPWLFLSTPSARRATLCRPELDPAGEYFYPRPPRGGRPRKPEAE